jgi:CheY-specific phosphatase CheX
MSTSLEGINVTNTALFEMSEILAASVAKMLRVKGDIYLSQPPVVREREIVEFARRMRVDGLEKFGSRTVFSSVTFHMDPERLEQGQAIGALVLYIPIDYIARLMWLLEYGRIDEDEDEVVQDACGTVTNLVAGYFVKELSGHGYIFLEMSHFESYINTAVNGVNFSPDQSVKHEIEFYIKDEKKIVAELTMSKLTRY